MLGIWTSLNGNQPKRLLHFSFYHYGNECWKLSKTQSQLDSDKYEAKGHRWLGHLLTSGKKQPWLTQELEKPSISVSWGSSGPWHSQQLQEGRVTCSDKQLCLITAIYTCDYKRVIDVCPFRAGKRMRWNNLCKALNTVQCLGHSRCSINAWFPFPALILWHPFVSASPLPSILLTCSFPSSPGRNQSDKGSEEQSKHTGAVKERK